MVSSRGTIIRIVIFANLNESLTNKSSAMNLILQQHEMFSNAGLSISDECVMLGRKRGWKAIMSIQIDQYRNNFGKRFGKELMD